MRSFMETLTFKLWLEHIYVEPVAKPSKIPQDLWDGLAEDQRKFVAWHEWMHDQAQLFYAEQARRHVGVVASTDYITNPPIKEKDCG